jgi:acyl-CoA thioesterase-1
VAEDAPITIVDLGDSYIIGHGIAAGETFPVRLQAALDAAGRSAKVVDTGFVGTSQLGLRWLTKTPVGMALLAEPAAHAVILELGQNDCLRFNLDATRENLDGILAELAARKIPVLVVGTAAYWLLRSGVHRRLSGGLSGTGSEVWRASLCGLQGRRDRAS